ncbi:MAG: transposase [Gammaproteobacteria bacterium]|nr:transposase [Gammaproteobacteria bacterium]
MINRKVTYRMYPNKKQADSLSDMFGIHLRVYNAALEERIRMYREENKSLSFSDQCKILTQWRQQHASLVAINAQSLQVTIKRLDLAFQAFYRRLKLGETPGFPRFKSSKRFSGWGYKTHGDGWRLFEGSNEKHGKIRLSGIGMLRLRGKARTPGAPKTCEIIYKAGKWYASVTMEREPNRSMGDKAIAFDWGVEKFLTLHDSKGHTEFIDNPRHLKSALKKLKMLQQSIARKTNKSTNNRKKAVEAFAREHVKITNRRRNFHHQLAARMVKENSLIAAETLSVKSMTVSAGIRKRGLNREILSTAPTQFYHLLKSKAEEAGALWIEIPTRQVKPSQTCHCCGAKMKKSLSERWHDCSCGASCDRDENASKVILNWALNWASGQELVEVGSRRSFATLNQETYTIL